MKKVLIAALAATASTTAVYADENPWSVSARAALEARLAVQHNTNQAKNVILMVADGNGVASAYATRIYAGQQAGGYGDDHVLPQERFPHLALVKTYNTNAQTPDSAGTATALLSGVKTRAGLIGVDDSVARGDCTNVPTGSTPTLAEIMAEEGRATGVISTARLTHATPASTYAHAADRNFEDDTGLPEGCGTPDIAAQMIDAMRAGTLDLAMGGGRRHFLPKDVQGDEGKSGRRGDGRNLIAEAGELGAQYAWNDETFAALSLNASNAPILALFESSHMKYEHDRVGEPSLAEMTAAAIEALSANDNGYFLVVESGRVDHANHAGNLHRTVTDGIAFADAIAKAVEMTDTADTLIVITADHDHALAFNGYCGRGSPITGLCYEIDGAGVAHTGEPTLGDDGKPYTVAGYLSGAGSILVEQEDGTYSGSRPDLTNEEAMDPDYLQQALIPRRSETHSAVDVAVYANGPWAHLFDGVIEQHEIFHMMHYAAFEAGDDDDDEESDD